MTAVVVLPAMAPEWAVETIDSLRELERTTSLVVVDNGPGLGADVAGRVWRYHRTGENLGVPASWNMGVDAVLECDASHLVIVSEAIIFGPDGGASWLDELEQHPLGMLSHAPGFHLIALGRPVLERVGRFDESFFPGYYEDNDYLRRMELAGFGRPPRSTAMCFRDRGTAHTLKSGLVEVEFGPLTEHYLRKWGGPPGHELFSTPFDR